MMTLKVWNTLSRATRKEILSYWVNDPENSAIFKPLLDEYHHNFDFDNYGKRLKKVLDDCYLRPSDGKIVISCEVSPIFADKKEKQAKTPVAKIKTPTTKKQAVNPAYKKAFIDAVASKNMTSAVCCLDKVIELFGGERKSIRINPEYNWNHKIEEVALYKNELWLYYYWQGDHTDGNDSVKLADVVSIVKRGGRYTIPAETEFAFGHTRYRHGDINIDKDELWSALKAVADAIKDK